MFRIVAITLAAFLALPAHASTDDPGQQLRDLLSNDLITINGLLQFRASYQEDRSIIGENGFRVSLLRVVARGDLEHSLDYFVQLSFIRAPALLDARLSWTPVPSTRFDLGAFRTPFSGEFQIPIADVDFINRSRSVVLAPGRQIGFAAEHAFDNGLTINAGVFNGNGVLRNLNDGDGFMGLGRLSGTHASGPVHVSGGVNAAWSRDQLALVPFPFSGERTVGGADVRITAGPNLLSGEVNASRLVPSDGSRTREPWGFQLTAGRSITERVQLLARYDVLDLDGGDGTQRFVILGTTLGMTTLLSAKLNYTIPTRGQWRDHQILAALQLDI